MNQTPPRRRLKRKVRISLLMIAFAIPTLFMSFTVVKSYFADEKAMSKEMINQETPKPEVPVTTPEEQPTEEAPDEKEEIVEPPTGKVVYLTFDDGPSHLTKDFLDVLEANDVLATFFMQGTNLQKENLQDSVKRATENGHYVGAHSMTHDYKTLYKDFQFVAEMRETLDLIRDITGTEPNLVRAPYGSAPGLNSEQARNQIVENELKLWDWTIDSEDWSLAKNPSQIVTNIKNSTKREQEVILMHEKEQTLAVLPEIIEFYKSQGYQFAVYHESYHFELNFQGDDRL